MPNKGSNYKDRIFLPLLGKEIRRRRKTLIGRPTQGAFRKLLVRTKPCAHVIVELEVGRIKDPNPELLREISEVLKWDHTEIVSLIAKEKYNVDVVPVHKLLNGLNGLTGNTMSSVFNGMRVTVVITKEPERKIS